MRPSEETLAAILSRNGYRITPQRRAVLHAIVSSNEHVTPAAVYSRAKRTCSKIGLVTVYRTLEALFELGLVCRIESSGKSQSYALAPEGHHHHIVCSGCGAVTDFSDCNLGDLERKLARETGFAIESHRLQFFGICPECRSRAAGEILK
jgi:Fur family ferric uptake transcriptional regulator